MTQTGWRSGEVWYLLWDAYPTGGWGMEIAPLAGRAARGKVRSPPRIQGGGPAP
jgi:hypothetical protein